MGAGKRASVRKKLTPQQKKAADRAKSKAYYKKADAEALKVHSRNEGYRGRAAGVKAVGDAPAMGPIERGGKKIKRRPKLKPLSKKRPRSRKK